MSVASRAREANRRAAIYSTRYRREFPTWVAFRAWQRVQLANWATVVNLGDPWLAQFRGDMTPMTFPLVLDTDPQPE